MSNIKKSKSIFIKMPFYTCQYLIFVNSSSILVFFRFMEKNREKTRKSRERAAVERSFSSQMTTDLDDSIGNQSKELDKT